MVTTSDEPRQREGSMRRLITSTAVFALAMLLLAPTAISSAQKTRPFVAVCVGVPDDPLALEVNVTGVCLATHLGRDRFESSHTVTPLPETFDPATNTIRLRVDNGVATHRAANGDMLFSEYAGGGVLNLGTGRIDFRFEGRWVGGTGRFADASGETTVVGVLENGVARFVDFGAIRF
jgi:hypothetical protein